MSIKVYGAMVVSKETKTFEGFLLVRDWYAQPVSAAKIRMRMKESLNPNQELYGNLFVVERCARDNAWT